MPGRDPVKTALVGIIRNEADDLLPWMGWHARLGVDTFVLFDDGSTDGTMDLLQAAAALHDVRIYRLPWSDGPVDGRQQHAYQTALHLLQGQCDWVGFLDSDEYLDLHRHSNLQAFLGDFSEEVGGVAISWCLQGSNQLVLRPVQPAFHAFTRHSRPEEPINRHVKSFVRPDCWDGGWINPHIFPLKKGHYVTPGQQQVNWERPGIQQALPDWGTARVRHYQVRSLEQFTERARRRANLQLRLPDFLAGDRNELEDRRPCAALGPVQAWMREVIFQGAAEALLPLPVAEPEAWQPPAPQLPFSLTRIVAWNGHGVGVQQDGLVQLLADTPVETKPETPGSAAAQALPQLYGLRMEFAPEHVFLLACTPQGLLNDFTFLEDRRLNGVLPYRVRPGNQQNSVALQQLQPQHFLSAPPGEALVADRLQVQLWENFTLDATPRFKEGNAWQSLPFIRFLQEGLRLPPTLAGLGALMRKDRHLALRLLPVFHARLSPEEQSALQEMLGPFRPYFFTDSPEAVKQPFR
ncbi:glycosyltransferase family 2 protein [Oecophyllibacter saccharovorans]|uniref:Glycosyltransferase family 2 protein n=1 Tax=Oecophyllibacter saccharovorans TaxID=2558360 RepID=A0A506ULK1_9PROT|nr:glycosyltransferase family 2 protein [Oecophyllibacter saccharovorans]